VLKEVSEIRLISPFRTILIYKHPSSFACVVDRKKFDRNLALDAVRKGAEIYSEQDVSDVVVNAEGVEIFVNAAKKKYRHNAKMVVLATGIDVRLNKKLGLGYPRKFINGIQAEVCSENNLIPSILVGKNVAPGAFAWIVPVENKKMRIGLITEEDPKIYFNNLIREFYPELQKDLLKKNIQVKAIAQGLQPGSFQDRILVVGEAAGQVKTTTGGGISFGLFCSNIAAQVIKKQFDSGDFSSKYLSEYERLWRRSIQRELLVGYFTRKICSKLTDEETEQLFQLARSNGVFPLIQKLGDFDWHSDLILALLKKAPVLFNKMKLSRFKSQF
jgi:flavin-dependent dehydrogenase